MSRQISKSAIQAAITAAPAKGKGGAPGSRNGGGSRKAVSLRQYAGQINFNSDNAMTFAVYNAKEVADGGGFDEAVLSGEVDSIAHFRIEWKGNIKSFAKELAKAEKELTKYSSDEFYIDVEID